MHIPLIPVGAAAALILILVFILLLWLLCLLFLFFFGAGDCSWAGGRKKGPGAAVRARLRLARGAASCQFRDNTFFLYARAYFILPAKRLSAWGPQKQSFGRGSQNRRRVRSSRHVLIERKHSNDARGLVVLLID
jgi:hypothetical protein